MSVDTLQRRGRPAAEATLKGGDLFLQNIQLPSTASPGQQFTVNVTASNGALSVQGAGNPDCCGPACGLPGPWATNGYLYEVGVDLRGLSRRAGGCLGTTEIGTFDREHSFSLTAPTSPGTYTVVLSLGLPESGASASTTREITVQESDGGNGDNGGNNGGNDPPDENGEGDFLFGLTRGEAVLAGGALGAAGLGVVALIRDDREGRGQ